MAYEEVDMRRRAFLALAVSAVSTACVGFGAHGRTREHLAELRKYHFVAEDEAELLKLDKKEMDRRYWAGLVFRYRPPARKAY